MEAKDKDKNLNSEKSFQKAIDELEKNIENVNADLANVDVELKKLYDLMEPLGKKRRKILEKVSVNSVNRNKLKASFLKFKFPSIKKEEEKRSKKNV